MTTTERAGVNREPLDIMQATAKEEKKLRLVVNNTRQGDKDRTEDSCKLIYDRPIFKARRHDPF